MTKHRRYPRGPAGIVNVTAAHIAFAKKRDSSHCMTAQAVRDAFPQATSISVDIQTIRFSYPEKRLRFTYLTPRIAQLAIVRWDQGKIPEPFNFRLSGAHVTAMTTRRQVGTPASRASAAVRAGMAKARKYSPSRKDAENILARATTAREQGTNASGVRRRVGGATPPTTPFAKRRAFGLRALQL